MTRAHTRAILTLATVSCALVVASSASATGIETGPSASPALPYSISGDVTGDGLVMSDDVDLLIEHLGAITGSDVWTDVEAGDRDDDGEITLADVVDVSQQMVYDDGPFTLLEASALDMQAAMNAGVTTSVEITQDYLDRIEAYDRTKVDPAETGRPLNSIISTNDAALAAAEAADQERDENGMTSLLLGVPVIVKDNYNTSDMPTTAGCACWEENQTTDDAFMVEGLRSQGAVMLAKASLDEFAYGFSSMFSAYEGTTVDGETTRQNAAYVASPFDTTKTAGGSSGGTGASIAANLGAIGFGSDTGGSIRVPSNYNQLVGIRPTVGLLSRDGIVPLALSQDTGGPMTRSVLDAAIAMDAVVGVDANDGVTAGQDGLVPETYTSQLDPTALAGTKIGYVPSMVPSLTATNARQAAAARRFDQAVADLEAQGAEVVPIEFSEEDALTFGRVLGEGSGSTNEFKHDLQEYMSRYLAPEVEADSLQKIVDSGAFVPNYRNTYVSRNNITEETYQAWAGPDGSHTLQIASGHDFVSAVMDELELDAMIYPSGIQYGTFSTNMRLSPNTGMPAVSVPMGTDASDPKAGVNLEFLGRKFDEGTLLGLAYAYEQATQHRTTPALYGALPEETP